MLRILLKILLAFVTITALMVACRLTFGYLAEIEMIDYITYSGIVSLVVALIAFDGNNPVNQHFLSMMVRRELVTRNNDKHDKLNQISFALTIGSVGFILIIVSGVMAWLS